MSLLSTTVICALGTGASLHGLGDLAGGAFFSRSYGISEDGSVVVGVSYTDEGTTGGEGCCEAFRWSSATGMVGLGDLGKGSPFESRATAVSADGSIIAGGGHIGVSMAFRYADGVMHELPELPGGGIGGAGASGISADGLRIVGSDSAENGREAFLFDSTTGAIIGLGDLPGGDFRSDATAISADGLVVVGSSRTGAGTEAFVWRAETGIVSLGDLPGGGQSSLAYACSSDGSVIVGYGTGPSGFEAFRHDAGGMHALGDLDGGEFDSRAYGVSGDGCTIVGFATSAFDREAVLWFDDGGPPVRVHDVLTRAGVDLTGWYLEDARAISTDGTHVTGFGTNPDGEREAWLARLPSCATDLDGNCTTGVGDLLIVLEAWGEAEHEADIDGDGIVGIGDLLAVLAGWGACH